MKHEEGDLIFVVLFALSEGPKSSDELIRHLQADVEELAGEPGEIAIRECLRQLVELEIVQESDSGYELKTSLDELKPLLRSLGTTPWDRLGNWKEKLRGDGQTRGKSAIETKSAVPAFDSYYVQEVFFATDRQPADEDSTAVFGSERMAEGQLNFGRCEVSIPHNHNLGSLESPSLVRLEFNYDPRKHVTLLVSQPLSEDALFESLKERLSAPESNVLVFVHGYNVSFRDAVRRTAQLAYDLQYQGAAITYSWPSHAELLDYAVDGNNAEWSQPHFQSFLADLGSRCGYQRINVIAHSMGTRVVTRSVANLASVQTEGIGTVVLAAPDIDRDVFLQLAAALRQGAKHVVLYVSSFDKALRVSQRLHGYPRAGDCGEGVVVSDGIQTIDVSMLAADFTGHGYFGNNISVMADLYYLLVGQTSRRFRLRAQMSSSDRVYWHFVP